MMKIMILIKARRNLNRGDLAQECEVSVRTIQRDINSLSYAGVPIFWAEDGYEIMPDFFLPPVNLNLEEALYLAIAAKASCEGKGESCQRKVESALSKIVASLPSEVQGQVSATMSIATSEGKSYSQILAELP
jgi:predicted DNA-binding transcriptional regulator YafY